MTEADKISLILYRLDELKEDMGQFREEVRSWHDDHEARLRAIEGQPKLGPPVGRGYYRNHGKEFWTSLVAFATALAAFATAFWKAVKP